MEDTTQQAMDLGIHSAGEEREARLAREMRNAHALVPEALMAQLRANDRDGSGKAPPVLKIFCPVRPVYIQPN